MILREHKLFERSNFLQNFSRTSVECVLRSTHAHLMSHFESPAGRTPQQQTIYLSTGLVAQHQYLWEQDWAHWLHKWQVTEWEKSWRDTMSNEEGHDNNTLTMGYIEAKHLRPCKGDTELIAGHSSTHCSEWGGIKRTWVGNAKKAMPPLLPKVPKTPINLNKISSASIWIIKTAKGSKNQLKEILTTWTRDKRHIRTEIPQQDHRH